jgi:farnesyl-diphosphate farnesyltransferase
MQDLLTDVLRNVSRSFYLTLRVLPGSIRPQIGLAYLLARATDTVADTQVVPVAGRLAALGQLRDRILGSSSDRLELDHFLAISPQGAPSLGERVLLDRLEDVLSCLDALAAPDRDRIRETLQIITGGQELDLQRFEMGRAGESPPSPETASLPVPVRALQSEAELDDYTYRVAGCVGEFWTRICQAHVFPGAGVDGEFLLRSGVRFGKGLQLVNILRDLPRDLRLGRCYLPARELAAAGLAPADLLDPAREPQVRGVYDAWCGRAREYLAAGWAYTNALPRGCMRLRLACAWPLLIGVQTLARLRERNMLDPAQRIRITRAEVRRILVRSVVRYPFPSAWNNLFTEAGSAGH